MICCIRNPWNWSSDWYVSSQFLDEVKSPTSEDPQKYMVLHIPQPVLMRIYLIYHVLHTSSVEELNQSETVGSRHSPSTYREMTLPVGNMNRYVRPWGGSRKSGRSSRGQVSTLRHGSPVPRYAHRLGLFLSRNFSSIVPLFLPNRKTGKTGNIPKVQI